MVKKHPKESISQLLLTFIFMYCINWIVMYIVSTRLHVQRHFKTFKLIGKTTVTSKKIPQKKMHSRADHRVKKVSVTQQSFTHEQEIFPSFFMKSSPFFFSKENIYRRTYFAGPILCMFVLWALASVGLWNFFKGGSKLRVI